MNANPNIIVQLIHVKGPLEGEIQKFNSNVIFIGRHSDCHVKFPKDLAILSRKHARIVWDVNRYKLIDQSTNGTFVNGQRVSQIHLKEGDVISFCRTGPRVRFHLTINDQIASQPKKSMPPKKPQTEAVTPPPQRAVQTSPSASIRPVEPQRPVTPSRPKTPPPPPSPPVPAAPPASEDGSISEARLVVQYGVSLKSFNSLPITLGKSNRCDVMLKQPTLADRQAQIFYDQDQYWIKDLSGTQAVEIDNVPLNNMAAMQPDMVISLSPQGPTFKYLGGGRLVEVELPTVEAPKPTSTQRELQPPPKTSGKLGGIVKKAGSIFQKG